MLTNKHTFKDIKKGESKQSQHWSTCLYNHIKQFPKNYPSSFGEMLTICGLEIDMNSVSLYQKFHTFLMKQRKKTDEMFEVLIQDGWFSKYKSDGLTEEEIYDRFVDTCVSYRLIPLYCDADGKYKLIDLPSFVLIKEERLRSACKEVVTKVSCLKVHSEVLPNAIASSIEGIKPILKAKSELEKFFLPEYVEDD